MKLFLDIHTPTLSIQDKIVVTKYCVLFTSGRTQKEYLACGGTLILKRIFLFDYTSRRCNKTHITKGLSRKKVEGGSCKTVKSENIGQS